jgi:ABC-type branched-subunit amino acid transport system ATPase component
LYHLLSNFFQEEKIGTAMIIALSFAINFFQINGISLLTADIIKSVEKNNQKLTLTYFKYFIAVSVIFMFLYNYYKINQNLLLTKLKHWVRHEMTKLILLVNNEDYDESNLTRLSSPIFRVSITCFYAFNNIFSYVLPNATLLFIIAGYFFYKSPLFGLFFLLSNLMVVFYIYMIWDEMMEIKDKFEDHVNSDEMQMSDMFNNIDKIIYRGETENQINDLYHQSHITSQHAISFYSTTNYHIFITSLLISIIVFISIGYLIRLYYTKKIDSVIFITFMTVLLLYRDRITSTFQQVPEFVDFAGRARYVIDLFDNLKVNYKDLDKIKYEPVDLPFDRICFEKVSFKYAASTKPTVNDFSACFETRNKIVGMTGKSGNGKSTLMKLLIKLYRPSSGRIIIDGKDIAEIDNVYLRKNIVYVNQNSRLFDKSVLKNIMYGCQKEEHCKEILDELMQFPKVKELFKDVNMNEKSAGLLGENLSGGQRQLVNIISGFVSHSPILILDEPTNALDGELKKEVLGIIKHCKKYKKCIIIISHDQDVLPLFDEVLKV